MNAVMPTQGTTTRRVVYRTRGSSHGPIARLMSPSDLGERLKPFVFLDRFEADLNALSGSMPLHPHSGIATVTVFTSGDATFDDPHAGHGILGYGGVEFVRAGSGIWHGKELSGGTSPTVQGFQLWLALPPDLENAPPDPQYQQSTPSVGPARLILGEYAGAKSPVRAPSGINYLVVTLQAGRTVDLSAANGPRGRVGRHRSRRAERRPARIEWRTGDLRTWQHRDHVRGRRKYRDDVRPRVRRASSA